MIQLEMNPTISRVTEVNVLRGEEMVADHLGSYGALGLVVRRPG